MIWWHIVFTSGVERCVSAPSPQPLCTYLLSFLRSCSCCAYLRLKRFVPNMDHWSIGWAFIFLSYRERNERRGIVCLQRLNGNIGRYIGGDPCLRHSVTEFGAFQILRRHPPVSCRRYGSAWTGVPHSGPRKFQSLSHMCALSRAWGPHLPSTKVVLKWNVIMIFR